MRTVSRLDKLCRKNAFILCKIKGVHERILEKLFTTRQNIGGDDRETFFLIHAPRTLRTFRPYTPPELSGISDPTLPQNSQPSLVSSYNPSELRRNKSVPSHSYQVAVSSLVPL